MTRDCSGRSSEVDPKRRVANVASCLGVTAGQAVAGVLANSTEPRKLLNKRAIGEALTASLV